MKKIASWLLRLFKWETLVPPIPSLNKSIICVAPHTSNFDFILGKLYAYAIGQKAGFLMKREWFFFPLGFFLKRMGGIPINRSKRNSTVEQILAYAATKKHFALAITPEGTRSAVANWKSGFYRIAKQGNMPIQLAVIDYQKRKLGIFEVFYPTEDESRDIAYIHKQYKKEQARFPKNFVEYPS